MCQNATRFAEICGDLTVKGNTSLADVSMSNLDVSQNATIGGDLTVVGDSVMLDVSMSNLDVSQNATIGADLTVIGDSVMLDVSMSNLDVSQNTEICGDLTVKGNTSLVDVSLANLDVSQNLNVNGNITIDGNLDLSCGSLTDVSFILFCDNTYIGPGNSFDISTSEVFRINQDALVIDTSKNVGIGIETPERLFHVVSDTEGAEMRVSTFGDASVNISNFSLTSANGTISTPTATNDGDNIGQIALSAYNGTNYNSGFQIRAMSAGDWSSASTRNMRTYFNQRTSSGNGLVMMINKNRDLVKLDGTSYTDISSASETFNEGIQTRVASSSGASISINCFDPNLGPSNTGRLVFRDFRTGDISDTTSVDTSNNEYMGYISWSGVLNSSIREYSRIQTQANVNDSSGAKLLFYTKGSSSNNDILAMTINENQSVGIGTTDPNGVLHTYRDDGENSLYVEASGNEVCALRFVNGLTHWRTALQSSYHYVIRKIDPGANRNVFVMTVDPSNSGAIQNGSFLIDLCGNISLFNSNVDGSDVSGSNSDFIFRHDVAQDPSGGGGSDGYPKIMIQGNSDNGDGDVTLCIRDNDTTSGSNIPQIIFQKNSDPLNLDSYIYRIRSNDQLGMVFTSDTKSDTMRLTQDNRVGINVANATPGNRLQIHNFSDSTVITDSGYVIAAGTGNYGILLEVSGNIGGNAALWLKNDTPGASPTTMFRVNNNGTTTVGTNYVGSYPARFQVDGYATIGLPFSAANFWGTNADNAPSFWTPYGYLGTNGSFDLALSCNGYRNSSGQWTSLDVSGSTSAGVLSLRPLDGSLRYFADSAFPTGSGTIPTERFRIAATGDITILQSNATYSFTSTSTSGYNGNFDIDNTAFKISHNSNSRVIRMQAGTTAAGVQLNVGATSWTTFSDETLKNNIEDISGAISKIMDISGVTYTISGDLIRYKDASFNDPIDPSNNPKQHSNDMDYGPRRRVGLIAQHVQKVLPEAVYKYSMSDNSGNNTDYLGISYTEIIPLLIEGIKEQQKKIDNLESRLAALENP